MTLLNQRNDIPHSLPIHRIPFPFIAFPSKVRISNAGGKRHAEYEVTSCVRSKMKGLVGANAVTTNSWSVWKRYSEFEALDANIRTQYGWQVKDLKFPGKKRFGNMDGAFLARRRVALDE